MNFLQSAKGIAQTFVSEEKRLRWRDEKRYRKRLKRWATSRARDVKDLYRVSLKHAAPISLPLVLISQIKRSGGTLLSQLFDGHSECHAHPFELYVGYPNKTVWPALDLNDSPNRWFKMLFETPASRAFRRDYRKVSPASGQEGDRFLFIFLPSLQREIFLNYCKTTPIATHRDIFNAYMTSYFHAWLNNHNACGEKKIITAFMSGMATPEENMDKFFSAYPDGRLLSIVRDPWSWYDSARRHDPRTCEDIENAMSLWKESAESMMRNKRNYGERVKILKFEELITQTESVMRSLSSYLNIRYEETLLFPTFNRMPIRADSSYPVETYGVLTAPLSRHKKNLSASEKKAIEGTALETYERVLQWVSAWLFAILSCVQGLTVT